MSVIKEESFDDICDDVNLFYSLLTKRNKAPEVSYSLRVYWSYRPILDL